MGEAIGELQEQLQLVSLSVLEKKVLEASLGRLEKAWRALSGQGEAQEEEE